MCVCVLLQVHVSLTSTWRHFLLKLLEDWLHFHFSLFWFSVSISVAFLAKAALPEVSKVTRWNVKECSQIRCEGHRVWRRLQLLRLLLLKSHLNSSSFYDNRISFHFLHRTPHFTHCETQWFAFYLRWMAKIKNRNLQAFQHINSLFFSFFKSFKKLNSKRLKLRIYTFLWGYKFIRAIETQFRHIFCPAAANAVCELHEVEPWWAVGPRGMKKCNPCCVQGFGVNRVHSQYETTATQRQVWAQPEGRKEAITRN